MTRRAVLVLDADQTSALAVVRSLGRQAIEVHVASADEAPIAGTSRHARQRLQYPDPMRNEAAFIDWLQERLRTPDYALVIPVTERTLVAMLRHRGRLDEARLAIAPAEALEQVLDKEQTMALARRLSVAVPRSEPVRDMAALEAAASRLGYPIVVKPSRSMGADGGERAQLTVTYARDLRELHRQAEHALRYGELLLQERFEGEGVGIELIADRGQIKYLFQHRRLHEVPLTGGGSSLRISEDPVPELADAAQRLVAALRWHGVAMVEFKHSRATGEYRLMEINGRFWGSLPLAVAAGADFPLMLFELLTAGTIRALPLARTGILCRHLARDLDWLEHVIRRAAPSGLAVIPKWPSVLHDCLLAFSPRHRFDVQSLSDPWPGLVDLGRIARRQFARLHDRRRTHRRLHSALQQARSGSGTAAGVVNAKSLLFVCHGNINRSVVAHAQAQRRFPTGVHLRSAGFHPQGDRPADPNMVRAAEAVGLDLTRWRSTVLDAAMIEGADLVFVMEFAHVERLEREYPAARGKIRLLGAVTAVDARDVEIDDPYGRDPETYNRILQRVIKAVDGWWALAPASATR